MSELYVPLHVHTHFSMLDGVATPDEYVKRAIELGMPGLAVTDHGTLSGHRQMYFAAKEAEIKPILGVEAYICQDRFDKRDRSERTLPLDLVYNHIILLAKNAEGLKNLGIMNEIAWTEGFYRKPRIDMEVLEKYREGIIVSSACMSGLIAKALEFDDIVRAKELVVWFKERFGEDFYIEVMPHNGDKLNRELLELADAYDIRPVVTPDCHHATADQRVIQEMMLLINSHAKLRKEATFESSVKFTDMMERIDHLYGDRFLTFKDFKIHMLSPAEMQTDMLLQGVTRTDIYTNTLHVLDKVEDYGLTKTDTVELPVDFNDPQRELATIALEGLSHKELITKPYLDRLGEELALIEEKSFAAYFLIVYDMINWAREQGIRVGPGRGSSAGSLVCYALGITQVDPLKYNLLFSRFIDPSRMDMPDIDSDIMDSRRDEIKQYLADKYHNVASVATFMEFSDKGIVRDISRVLNVPLSDVNKVLKKCNDWEDFLENDACKWFNDLYPEVAKYGQQIKGRIRGTGAHAAGVVLSRQPLRNFAPIETRSRPKGEDRLVVVGLDGDEAAEAGLTKIDVLGLKTLTVIDDCIHVIKERHGILIDLNKINLEEAEVYKLLSDGFTKGVFQCEATPYTNLLIKMKVKNLDELAASNALVRPGAANTIGKLYIDRKNGRGAISYPNEAMRQITKDTYGCILYQEQVMQACTMLGGMSGGEANKVRKIIGKKRDASEFDVFKDKFIKNASGPLGSGIAESLWHDFEAHAGYSFNKSHAVAYSLLSYWCAWLKTFYPVEFMAALLKNEDDPDMRTQYLIEAKRMGIPVRLPHINKSGLDFEIDGDGLIIGLVAIKYISDNIASKYIAARPFKSYAEVEAFTFTKGNGVNSRALAALTAVGALTFDDKPRDDEWIKSNLYEYLNLPEIEFDMPPWFDAYFTDIADYEEGETTLIKGICKKIKRGNGWSLLEFLDKSGMVGIFDKEDTELEKGKMYAVLVAGKRIAQAIPADLIKDTTIPLVKFLNYQETPYGPGEFYVLGFKPRTTKAGKKMASMTLANSDREIKDITVFPAMFTEAFMHCEPGTIQKLKFKKLDDGGISLAAIER